MATHITQIEDSERGKTVLRVEGEMLLDDALLLERIALGFESEIGSNVLIDLADLDFIDSDAASVLKRLHDQYGVEIDGIEIFLQAVVNEVENTRT